MSAISRFPDELAEFERLQVLACEPERTTSAHSQLIKFAESLVQRFPDEADAHQMLGLAWYEYPASSSVRSWRCRMALEQAIKIEPDHQYALQYLAYLAGDQERYEEALRLHQLLRHDYFIERSQEWRALKNVELSLVCRLRLEMNCFPHDDFAAFCAWYQDALRRDGDIPSGSYVWPQELREYAEWVFESGHPFADSRLDLILRFLQKVSYIDTIRSAALRSYADELARSHGK